MMTSSSSCRAWIASLHRRRRRLHPELPVFRSPRPTGRRQARQQNRGEPDNEAGPQRRPWRAPPETPRQQHHVLAAPLRRGRSRVIQHRRPGDAFAEATPWTIPRRIAIGAPISAAGRARAAAFRQPGFRQPGSGAVTGPTVHQSFPHRQLGRAFARLRILSQATLMSAIRRRRTARLSPPARNNHI